MNEARHRDGPNGRRSPRAGRTLGDRTTRRPLTLASALRRRLGLFCCVFGAIVGGTLLVTLLQPPRFTAVAEVALNGGDSAATSGGAAREIRIIRSREMARTVAAALRLDRDAAFVRPTGSGPTLMRRLRQLAGGADTPPPAPAPDEAARRSVERLADGLAVDRVADTYSLTIAYTAEDARTAARVANEFAREYAEWPATHGGAPAPTGPHAAPRIISEAEPPLAPGSPRPLRNLAFALVLGTWLALVAAYVAERRFAGLTSGDEVEDRLGLFHLGSVPTLASLLPDARSALDAVVEQPMSGFAESFRSVLGAIRDTDARRAQVVAITSALPNEGKSTIAGCLARTLALAGDRIVLVDCDARRRDVGTLFLDVERRPGLAEVLRGEATLDEALVRDRASNAWLLPLTGPPAQLSELLAGPAMAALLEELRQRFTRVLIDTAPVLALAETRVIATMVDLVVIVVRWRATADHAVRAALKLLPRARGQIAGVVLSRVDMRKQVKYAEGDPSFYYRQYSKYYS